MSNILDYRPEKPQKKDIGLELIKLQESGNSIQSKLYTPSNSLQQLKDYLPSATLQSINDSINALDDMIKNIDDELKETTINGVSFDKYKQAVESNDLDIIDKVEDYNANDINGNYKLELYYPLKNISNDLKEFNNFFKQQNYGSDLTQEQVERIDNNNINKLTDNEMSNPDSINYTAIGTDIQINAVVALYAANVVSNIEQITNISTDTTQYNFDNINTSTTNMINGVFSSNVDIANKDKVKLRQGLNSTIKSHIVNKVYDKRRELLSAMQSADAIYSMPESAVKTKMVNYLNLLYNETKDAILDMYKSTLSESLYLNDYITTVGDKQETRNMNSAYKKTGQ